MNYPLISEYIDAIKSAEDNFEKLSYLKPVLGNDGLPVMTSGNFLVYRMKCEQSGNTYYENNRGETKSYYIKTIQTNFLDAPKAFVRFATEDFYFKYYITP